MPKKIGNTSIEITKNIKVLPKERIADILPFCSAVNRADALAFNPINKKDKA